MYFKFLYELYDSGFPQIRNGLHDELFLQSDFSLGHYSTKFFIPVMWQEKMTFLI